MVDLLPHCDLERRKMTENDQPVQSVAKQVVREIASSELLRGEAELLIRHGDEIYRLKLTRNGKLILQK